MLRQFGIRWSVYRQLMRDRKLGRPECGEISWYASQLTKELSTKSELAEDGIREFVQELAMLDSEVQETFPCSASARLIKEILSFIKFFGGLHSSSVKSIVECSYEPITSPIALRSRELSCFDSDGKPRKFSRQDRWSRLKEERAHLDVRSDSMVRKKSGMVSSQHASSSLRARARRRHSRTVNPW